MKKYPLIKVYKDIKKFHEPLVKEVLCCPFCGEPLVQRGTAELITLCEHVCNPNGNGSEKPALYCENPNCRLGKLFLWNGNTPFEPGGEAFLNNEVAFTKDENGENQWTEEALRLHKESFGWCHNAGNSFACKQEHEKEWDIYLHPAFLLGKYMPVIEMQPIAKEDGTIVKTKPSFKLLKKDTNRSEYCILHISGIKMFMFDFKQRVKGRNRKRLKKYLDSDIVEEKYLNDFRRAAIAVFGNEHYPKRFWKKEDWWRSAAEKCARLIYKKDFKRCLALAKKSYSMCDFEDFEELLFNY